MFILFPNRLFNVLRCLEVSCLCLFTLGIAQLLT
uniref:Uncharacterized protein n=1 Tax=Anguilla anguilla TaxID=7936 RepID=A0A0E9VH25_ANGAN